MKRKFLLPFMALGLGALVVYSCGKDKPVSSESTEVATTKDGTAYVVDTANSKIEWKGFKVFKSEHTNHFGTIKFVNGELTAKDGVLESGKFTANMNSLQNVDIADPTGKGKLEGHLKSADFFDVAKFPEASFEITKVTPSTSGDFNTILDGNLVIKGVSKSVQLNANTAVTDSQVTIATEPKEINREEFGVKFQSPAENGVIKNEVELQILIKASVK